MMILPRVSRLRLSTAQSGLEPFHPRFQHGEALGVVLDLVERPGVAPAMDPGLPLIPKRALELS